MADRTASGKGSSAWLGCGDIPWLANMRVKSRFNLLLLVFVSVYVLVGLSYGFGEVSTSSSLRDNAGFRRIADLTADLRAGTLAMESAANAVIGLEYNGLMPVPCQLIGHGKAHRAGTQHCNPFTHG